MKRLTTIGITFFSLLTCFSAQGQNLPPGAINQIISCSLNEGTTMAEAVAFARNNPRDDNAPNQVYFRQAIFAPGFKENYDFTIVSYYPSFSEMNTRITARNARPDIRARSGRRGSDFFTCDSATQRVLLNRTINPDNDGFSGDQTLMSVRFCQLNEGETAADAFTFGQGVARNFRAAGDNSMMQLYTILLGPVGEAVAGRGLAIATVAATSSSYAARIDLPNGGFSPTEGLTLPMACDYPAMWRTNTIYRAGN
jgi:hypothetical protein